MNVIFLLFSKEIEEVLSRCDNISLLDSNKYKNYKFIDNEYKPEIKSVIIKEAELSK